MALAYETIGQGPPLALLHPLGADREVWRPLVGYLREHRELILIDLPGFGASAPLGTSRPSPQALAGAVAELLRTIGVDRAHVAGNSLGGWVALELGLRAPVLSTTAISPAGLWSSPLVAKPSAAHVLAGQLVPLAGPLARSRTGRRLLLRSAVSDPSRVPGPEAAHLVRAYAKAPGFIAVNNEMRAGRFEGLERIRGPLTLVWPDHDRLVRRPPWLPGNVRNVVLDQAGHIPMWDQPAALSDVLLTATGGTPAQGLAGSGAVGCP